MRSYFVRRDACGRRAAACLGLVLLAAAAGCSRDTVVEAGRTRVTRADVADALARRAATNRDPATVVDQLATRALLAEAGRRQGLRDDPAVRVRLASAEREILAQAFLERALADAEREDALRARYEAHKGELARRRIHVAHIALHATPAQDGRAAALSDATRCYARLAGGEPFDALAREESDDPVSAARGGDLGPLLEGEVDAAFFDAAAALAPGEVSKPVETPFGFHVVKALAPADVVTPAFDEVRGLLAAEARKEAQAALLARLREDIGVEIHAERVPDAAAPRP